jgi:hypothetical protein
MKSLTTCAIFTCTTVACASPDLPTTTTIEQFDVDDAVFVDDVSHRYLPLVPGTVSALEHAEGRERTEIRVLLDKALVNGVEATEIRVTTRVDGELIKDTYGRYAQDDEGKVWHLGESVCAFDGGQCTSMEGTWAWGENGGRPGVVLQADPDVDGDRYFEATAVGAQDIVEVAAVLASTTVPAGTFDDCVVTRAWRLFPARNELRTYCAGVGVVRVVKPRFIDELVEVAGPEGVIQQ